LVLLVAESGYADSFGFSRIITNSYFRSYTFSKFDQMKFVLILSFESLTKHPILSSYQLCSFLNIFKI